MGKKGKGYLKGREHFEAVARGDAKDRGSKYARKVVDRIQGAGQERDPVLMSAPLQNKFEDQAVARSAQTAHKPKTPFEILRETGTMMTDAYFFGASRPVVTARHFIDAAMVPPFFKAVDDEAFKNKPCRLIAICHNDGDCLHTWTLRRVVGKTGNNYEDIQLRSTHVNMYAFLKSWEKDQSLFNRTEALLPRDLRAVLVSSLSTSGVSQVSTDIQTEKLQSRGFELKSIF